MGTTTSPVQGFPRDLLTQPIASRLRYFETKVVAHQRLKEVHATLLHAIRHPAGASLILVFGPTGVGKTTLRQRIERQLLEDAVTGSTSNPGHIPVATMEAASPDTGSFHWKDYYTRALLALDEPFITDKITYDVRDMHRDEQGRLVIERNLTIPDLRRALEKTLLYRQPRAFIVDEAQHFRKMSSGRRLLDQMDNLKSLAGMTNTVHVLVGTYELLGLTNLSAQLSRRSIEIHFGRYRAELHDDRLAFKSVVLTLQHHLPLASEPDLVGSWDALYEGSLGCVGVLKNWLNRALADALAHGAVTPTRRHLDRQALPTRTLLNLAREIAEGEAALREAPGGRDQLRSLLGLPVSM